MIELLATSSAVLVSTFAPLLSFARQCLTVTGNFAPIPFAVLAALIGIACCFWAAWSYARLGNIRIDADHQKALADSALRLRDEILAHSGRSIVVLGAEMKSPISYGGGAALLESGLEGGDAPIFASALHSLITDGAPFEFSVRTRKGDRTVAKALPIFGRAVVFLSNSAALDEHVDDHAETHALPNSIGLPQPAASAGRVECGSSDNERTNRKMKVAAEAAADTLDKLSVGIVVFGRNHRLKHYNTAYQRLWGFPRDWLDTCPTQDEILDRLHESRLLPEQHDFISWKQHFLDLGKENGLRSEEFWHMPGGRSLRVTADKHLEGGLLFTFEDVSKTLQLKAMLASLFAVHKATLDNIEDAVAIFEPDGRLTQHNHAFEKLWHLSGKDLESNPHFNDLANMCIARIGRDGIWDIVSSAIAATNPEQYGEWGNVTRSDGKVIALAPFRLPNGATLITFRDVTDIAHFRVLLSEPSHSAA